MLRFPINCLIAMYSDRNLCKSSRIQELTDNWNILCEWKENNRLCSIDYIRICRLFTSKEMLVFGTISLVKNQTTVSTVDFSKLMGEGSSSAEINLSYSDEVPEPIYHCPIITTAYALDGVIYITNCNENCSCDFDDGERKVSAQTNQLVQLSNDLEKLLDSKTCCFADVNLNCNGGSIPAHKVLLSARSPVYAAMFKNPMKENQKNQVDITDMDAAILRAMLTYIYTGKLSSLTISSATNLLFAADKYQLQDLKRVCCDFLKQNTSLENVLTVLVLGDLNAPDLKSFAVDYMAKNCTNFSEFQNKEEWKSLRKGRPILAVDVLTSLVISKERK